MKKKATPTGSTETLKGATIEEYSDGSWRYTGDNGKTKGALARKPAWLTSFNKETSLEAHEAKKDIRRERARRGVIEGARGVSPHPIGTADDAFEFIVEKRTEVALSGDAGSLADAKWIDELLYGDQKKETPKVVIHLDNATINAFHQTERMLEDMSTIDGEFVEE